jgi:uncharacterized membrane protein
MPDVGLDVGVDVEMDVEMDVVVVVIGHRHVAMDLDRIMVVMVVMVVMEAMVETMDPMVQDMVYMHWVDAVETTMIYVVVLVVAMEDAVYGKKTYLSKKGPFLNSNGEKMKSHCCSSF